MKDIKIPSNKGNLDATIHEADSNKLAILCPGFLDSKDYTGLRELAKRLNNQEYTVVRFDPIGVWGSAGDIADYTMTQYLKDIKVILEYMLKKIITQRYYSADTVEAAKYHFFTRLEIQESPQSLLLCPRPVQQRE